MEPTDLVIALRDSQQLIVAGAVALVGIVLWRRRVDPVIGAATIWLTVFVANPDFFFTYLIWGTAVLPHRGRCVRPRSRSSSR